MAVGDGGGISVSPDENQTGLVNESFRTHLNSLKIPDNDKNIIIAEMIIPGNRRFHYKGGGPFR